MPSETWHLNSMSEIYSEAPGRGLVGLFVSRHERVPGTLALASAHIERLARFAICCRDPPALALSDVSTKLELNTWFLIPSSFNQHRYALLAMSFNASRRRRCQPVPSPSTARVPRSQRRHRGAIYQCENGSNGRSVQMFDIPCAVPMI